MSLLGFMLVMRVSRINSDDEQVWGLSYHFYDVAIKKYSSQDHVQVLAVVEAIVKKIHTDFPAIKQLMLGSDNASCLSSHDSIPYVHAINLRLDGIKINKWIYTEACTGENRLDAHFSFVNLVLGAFIRDQNEIYLEEDIYDALCHQGGIMGSSAILFDGENLKGPVLQNGKEFKATKTGVRETHEVLWTHETPHVYTISDITTPERVTMRKLTNYPASKLHTTILRSHLSSKPALFIPDERVCIVNDEECVAANTETDLTIIVKTALELADVDFGDNNDDEGPIIEYVPQTDDSKDYFPPGWACYPKREKCRLMTLETMQMLNNLFMRGNADKARRVSADRARLQIIKEVAYNNWYEQTLVTEERVKAFFGMNLVKQRKLINEASARLGLADCDFNPVNDGNINIIDEFESSVNNEVTARVEELELQEIDAGEDIELNEMNAVEEGDWELDEGRSDDGPGEGDRNRV